MKRIDRLRSELTELVIEYGFLHPFVLKKSKQLDQLIVRSLKKISDIKKRKVLLAYLQEIQKKHILFEKKYHGLDPIDPIDFKKSRELDIAIIDYIHQLNAYLERKTIK